MTDWLVKLTSPDNRAIEHVLTYPTCLLRLVCRPMSDLCVGFPIVVFKRLEYMSNMAGVL